MNVFVLELARKELEGHNKEHSERIKIEDNIGESIHIHYYNTRQEFTVNEFEKFADGVEKAFKEIKNGN